MNLVEHKARGDMKVWLSQDELAQLTELPDDTERKIALKLAGYCGLRSHEVLDVAPKHVHDTEVGKMLWVPEGKGDERRETPIPDTLAGNIEVAGHFADDESPVVTAKTTRSLRDWINSARRQLVEETGDERWGHVSMHDLRRTWATQLSNKEVDPLVVCQWGGWNDLDTFLDHYQGAFSPEAQARERKKVDWL